MIIDWHAHIYTPEEAADDRRTYDGTSGPSWGERGCPMVLENFLDAHRQAGIDVSVVTNAAIICGARRQARNCPRCKTGATTRPRCRKNTKARLFVLPRSCRAAGRHSSKRPSAPCASSD